MRSISKHVTSFAILISRFASFRSFRSQIKLCKHVQLLPLFIPRSLPFLQLFLFRKLVHETCLPRSCLDRQSRLVAARLYLLLAKWLKVCAILPSLLLHEQRRKMWRSRSRVDGRRSDNRPSYHWPTERNIGKTIKATYRE